MVAAVSIWAPCFVIAVVSSTLASGGEPPDPKSEQLKQRIEQMQADEFKLLDRNGDGVVHVHELEEVKKQLKDRASKEGEVKLRKHESSLLGKLEKDHVDWHVKLDKNGDGHVTQEEHKQLWDIKATATETKTKKEKKAASEVDDIHIHDIQKLQFETMDANNDGRVSKQEMVDTMHKLKARKELGGGKGLKKHEDSLLGKLEKGPEDMHKKSDANGDGHLTWDEYKFKKRDGPQTAEL